ncbi:molybdenum ABC transporter ATP-binding protein [Polycladidibacter stylochi]|uniref:molybdenum ABC transporter ATP-binding protein n=1 Tax=Polycladidibacter stylochi TaxID=1807766 RepID=UPI0008307010|nr:molybdenum ABC transporter ATP-binding protein [Pseudovibrio stylochi]
MPLNMQGGDASSSSHRKEGLHLVLKGQLGQFKMDVDFSIAPNGVTALFGPSGCGKTSILRAIAGLAHLEGTITCFGEQWQNSKERVFVPTHKRAVGYVFQEANLFAHMSIKENLLFGRKRLPPSHLTGQPTFEEIVDLLKLSPLLHRLPSALSGGERQRVAIGRALLAAPQILLMDEPLSALDRQAKQEILPYLEALHLRLKLPIVYVSHDIAEVAQLADTMVSLNNGRIASQGPIIHELARLGPLPGVEPRRTVSLIPAEVIAQDNTYHLSLLSIGKQNLEVPHLNANVGDSVRLHIAAGDVALAKEYPKEISMRNVLKGCLVEVHEYDSTAYAEVLLHIDGIALKSRLTRASLHQLRLAKGDTVYALIKSIIFADRSL